MTATIVPGASAVTRFDKGARRLGRLALQERGNSAVELAIVLPLLMSLVFGASDFARIFYAYMTVASAAHEAATYLAGNSTATTTDLQNVAAAEAQLTSGSFLTFTGTTPNTTLTKVTTLASGTVDTTLIVRVQLTYSFQPVVPIPLKGPIPVTVVASAPKGRALT